jgi:anti-anti-sigma factor
MAPAMLAPSPCAEHGVMSALTTVVVRAEGARTVVAVGGEADLFNRPALSQALSTVIASHDGDVVVDLAETAFIDTAIVRALADAHRMLGLQGRTVTFRSPSRLAARLLDLFGLTDLIESAGVLSGPSRERSQLCTSD